MALASHFYRANLQANLAGHLFVRDVELQRLTTLQRLDAAFLHVPFEEAVEHFTERQVISPEAFAELSNAERFRAFTMSRVVSETIRERAAELIRQSLQEGDIGLREFARMVQADEAKLGFTPSSRGYLENVFLTSVATSYNAGRFEQQTDPDVIATGGVWEYLTADDARVRPAAGARTEENHRALDGKQWVLGDPEAFPFYPANGFRCRCTMVVVPKSDKKRAKMNQETRIQWVHENFRAAPGEFIRSEAAQSSPA